MPDTLPAESMVIREPRVIAEIGCNHQGKFDIAKEMIKTAAEYCGVYGVKFQKRNLDALSQTHEYLAPHPRPENAFGETYGEHRKHLEFSLEQHRQLKAYSESLGVHYLASVWDVVSAQEIVSLRPGMIKVPSAHNLDFPLLKQLRDNYSGEIHVSFGMTTPEEEKKIIEYFEEKGRQQDVVVYSCVSGYPVEFKDLSLLDLLRLHNAYGTRVKTIGFSGHHLGISADVAAMLLGANFIERHFTLNRTWKGTDHAASLEPDGLRKLVRDLKNVGAAMHEKQNPILAVEESQRKKLKKVIYE